MFDTHCHLQTDAYDEDRETVLAEARSAGVKRFLVPAIDHASFAATRALSDRHADIYYALGIHPHHAKEWSDAVCAEIEEAAHSGSRMVAVGEIGLDYYYDFAPKDVQQRAFSAQLALARALDLPVAIHTRESDEDVHAIVRDHYQDAPPEAARGQFHCFSGTVETMQKAVALGFFVSFTGNITFKKSTLSDVVREAPLESILLETDSPYLSPVPYRGKRNTPVYLKLIADKIAEIKGVEVSLVMKQTYENALRLFRIIPVLLILLTGLATLSSTAFAQRTEPAGSAPPDSILTPERRREEELRKKQHETLQREAEQRRQDSLRDAEREQQQYLQKMQEQARLDSVRAAEKLSDEARQRAKMLTPIAWKAIGIGGAVGIGNMPMIIDGPFLTPTSVFASTFLVGTQITRRLDFEINYSQYTVADVFAQDSIYNYGPGTGSPHPYTKAAYKPGVRLLTDESIKISSLSFDLRYVFTQPTAFLNIYLGLGYGILTMKNTQHYYNNIPGDSVHFEATPTGTFAESFTRGAIKLLFGVKHDFELGGGFILTPFAQVAAQGALAGASQEAAFIFRPDADQIITTHESAGVTLYFGWFGVPRDK